MNIVAFSDSHNRHKKLILPEGDIIICAGDISGSGTKYEVESFIKWYGDLDYKHKILIAGNHDWYFERNPTEADELCDEYGITYLNDSGVEIDGVKFWGSPVQPWFYDWAFNRARTEQEAIVFNRKWIKPHWDKIPEDTNVLITHGPPYKILDELVYVDGTPKGEFVGCNLLRERILELPQLKAHIFGHIHNQNGTIDIDGVKYYNVCVCDESYIASQPVTVFEI